MRPTRSILAAALLVSLAPVPALAASVLQQLNKSTNDGVYSLTAEQAAALGYVDAGFIAFYRVREGNGTTFSFGDAFDETTLRNSVKSNGGGILAFLNGRASGLDYQGAAFEKLGRTVIASDASSFYEGVAFLFGAGAGAITFNKSGGTTTFSASQSRGGFVMPVVERRPAAEVVPVAAVPVPAAFGLLAAGLGLLGAAGLRRRLAS